MFGLFGNILILQLPVVFTLKNESELQDIPQSLVTFLH